MTPEEKKKFLFGEVIVVAGDLICLVVGNKDLAGVRNLVKNGVCEADYSRPEKCNKKIKKIIRIKSCFESTDALPPRTRNNFNF